MSKITREEAIEILKCMLPKPIRADGKSTLHLMQTQALLKGIEALENQKTGHWINVDYGYYECSECGRIEMGNPNYCQNCGAKMEQKEN